MNTKLPTAFLLMPLFLFLSACGGSTDYLALGPGDKYDFCPVIANEPSTASYTISWDDVNYPAFTGLTGFKVYYGTPKNLDKNNAAGSFDVIGNVFSTQFSPNEYAYLTCQKVYFVVRAVGSLDESFISNIAQIIVE